MRKTWVPILVILLFLGFSALRNSSNNSGRINSNTTRHTANHRSSRNINNSSSAADQQLKDAFESRQTDVQLSGAGKVIKLLPQDNAGRRHQKFIIRLNSGQTLLIAHNIDLAPKISSLKVGDIVAFYGEYEWDARGGVIHWTHHDPNGRHKDGWIKHAGKTYQ